MGIGGRSGRLDRGRQGLALARGFGLLLQLGAAFAFLGHGSGLGLLAHVHGLAAVATVSPPVLNASYLGTVIIGLAGLVTAFVLSRARGRLRDYEAPFEFIALAWGMVWWLVGGVHEISRFFDGQDEISLILLFVAASALATALIARTLQWNALAMVPIGLFAVMLLTAASVIFDYPASHPFAGWGAPAWFVAFTVHYLALNRFEGRWPGAVTRLWHIGGFLLAVLLVTVECIWVIERYGQIATAWKFAAWALRTYCHGHVAAALGRACAVAFCTLSSRNQRPGTCAAPGGAGGVEPYGAWRTW